jgi:uncharacterized protein (DUF1499 family)
VPDPAPPPASSARSVSPAPTARAAAAPPRRRSPLALGALAVAVLAGLTMVVAGLATRWGICELATGRGLLRWAVVGALVALLLGVFALRHAAPGSGRRGLSLALLGLLIGLVETLVPLFLLLRAHGAPPIHDISTDTAHPPAFVAVVPQRAGAPNPVEYGGPAVANQQRGAFPDLQPLLLDLSAERAYERADAVARELGWDIVAADAAQGRLEATDRTFWFGQREDVVVRVTPAGTRSVVDVRSLSRAGEGDGGSNARRVRRFLRAMQR